jgi:hypothetical protein
MKTCPNAKNIQHRKNVKRIFNPRVILEVQRISERAKDRT